MSDQQHSSRKVLVTICNKKGASCSKHWKKIIASMCYVHKRRSRLYRSLLTDWYTGNSRSDQLICNNANTARFMDPTGATVIFSNEAWITRRYSISEAVKDCVPISSGRPKHSSESRCTEERIGRPMVSSDTTSKVCATREGLDDNKSMLPSISTSSLQLAHGDCRVAMTDV